MKTGDVISPGRIANGEMTQSAKIAHGIVQHCIKTYVPEDREAAVEQALTKFYIKMKEEAKQELKLQSLRSIGSNKVPQ